MIDWTVRYVFENRGSIIVSVNAPGESDARTLARQEARKHFDDETLDAASDVVVRRKDAPEGNLGDVLARLMNGVRDGAEEAAKTLAMSDYTDYHLAADFKRIRDAAADALKRIERISTED